MKIWLGKTLHPAILAFKGATLLRKDGERVFTSYHSFPIRRLYGFAIGRTVVGILRCDKPRNDQMKPEQRR
jgi:hypothetical protein